MQFKMEPKESIKSLKEPEKRLKINNPNPRNDKAAAPGSKIPARPPLSFPDHNQAQTQVLSVMPSTASSFLRILATNLSRSSAVNSSSPCLKVTVKAILFMVGGIGMPS